LRSLHSASQLPNALAMRALTSPKPMATSTLGTSGTPADAKPGANATP
jgi:hypothetical protein